MTELQKKLVAGGSFAVVAAGVLYLELRDDSPRPNPVPVVATAPAASPAVSGPTGTGPGGAVLSTAVGGAAAKNVANPSTQLDPTLKMGSMLVTESLVYSGMGRNIFSAAPVVVAAIPRPVAPARPKPVTLPVYAGPVGPPPPPPINLKFFGTATSAGGKRQAFLLSKGEDVFLASDGDIVQRRYRVISVSANSVLVEDLANNNRQTLPLVTN